MALVLSNLFLVKLDRDPCKSLVDVSVFEEAFRFVNDFLVVPDCHSTSFQNECANVSTIFWEF